MKAAVAFVTRTHRSSQARQSSYAPAAAAQRALTVVQSRAAYAAFHVSLANLPMSAKSTCLCTWLGDRVASTAERSFQKLPAGPHTAFRNNFPYGAMAADMLADIRCGSVRSPAGPISILPRGYPIICLCQSATTFCGSETSTISN